MKKILTLLTSAISLVIMYPQFAFASDASASSSELGSRLPIWSCIPFVGMLLSIAVIPLIKEEWWERNKKFVVIFWIAAFIIPFAVAYGPYIALDHIAEVLIGDYLTFIVLLFGLFCVAGNISLEGNLKGSPKLNVFLILVGTLLASWIGTTGASMIMIRPLIRANSWRKRKQQVIVFFIFLVSNIGGCLTPIGDPPLLMGFMRGVPFFWSMRLMPILLLNSAILLIVFYFLDRRAYLKDHAEGIIEPQVEPAEKYHKVVGVHNFIFLLVIVAAVVLSGLLPSLPVFQDALGNEIGIHVIGDVTLTYSTLIEIAMILFAAFMSKVTTDNAVREKNLFTYEPMKEVALLFIGIFLTMIPALLILDARGGQLNINSPAKMFWATGLLSSFLDNTPTYLVFLTTAGTMGATAGIHATVGTISQIMLAAISCGAVFMGANTYIGNAPNFMVRAIAEEDGIKMPSFFGYMLWSLVFLIPLFALDTLIFFR